MRNVLAFHVSVPVDSTGAVLPTAEEGAVLRWLSDAGLLLEGAGAGAPEGAIRFEHYAAPTIYELGRIEEFQHDAAGGLAAWLDLHTGIERTRARVVEEIEAELWPPTPTNQRAGRHTSRPEATGRAAGEHIRMLNEAWAKVDSKTMRGLQVMTNRMDRIIFCAEWRTLIHAPFPGWEDIGAREWPDYLVFVWVWKAWLSARQDARKGKA